MADAQLVVATRRLMGDLRDLKSSLRKTYPNKRRQVTSPELRRQAFSLAEIWLTNLSQRPAIELSVSAEYLADLNVHFQRLLIFSEQATLRSRYDEEIKSIVRNYMKQLVVPLMQAGNRPQAQAAGAIPKVKQAKAQQVAEPFRPTAFVGHSFAAADMPVIETFVSLLEAVGISVVTGERPKADTVSEKVKRRIEGQHLFVGIFTRRDQLVGKDKWNTSAWVIDEKAYAYGRNKKLILLKEADVESIGGIQGDYEYIEFSREKLQDAVVELLQVFALTVRGLHEG